MRYRRATTVPGRNRPCWPESDDESPEPGAAPARGGETASAANGSVDREEAEASSAPHEEQKRLPSGISLLHDGQMIIGASQRWSVPPRLVRGVGKLSSGYPTYPLGQSLSRFSGTRTPQRSSTPTAACCLARSPHGWRRARRSGCRSPSPRWPPAGEAGRSAWAAVAATPG